MKTINLNGKKSVAKDAALGVICVFFLIATAKDVTAQPSTFSKGDNVVNLGVGLGGNYWTEHGADNLSVPFTFLSYERCIVNLFNDKGSIGVGGLVGYSAFQWKQSGTGWRSNDVFAGIRGALHCELVSKLDTYACLMLGYNFNSWKTFSGGIKAIGLSRFEWGAFVGARYYFSESFAIFAEAGLGYSNINGGISIKF